MSSILPFITKEDSFNIAIASIWQLFLSWLIEKGNDPKNSIESIQEMLNGVNNIKKEKQKYEDQTIIQGLDSLKTSAASLGLGPLGVSVASSAPGAYSLLSNAISTKADLDFITGSKVLGLQAATPYVLKMTEDATFFTRLITKSMLLVGNKFMIEKFAASMNTTASNLWSWAQSTYAFLFTGEKKTDVVQEFLNWLAKSGLQIPDEAKPIIRNHGIKIVSFIILFLLISNQLFQSYWDSDFTTEIGIKFDKINETAEKWANIRPPGFFDQNGRVFLPAYNPNLVFNYLQKEKNEVDIKSMKEAVSILDNSRKNACTPNQKWQEYSLCE
jgi:hypothetical protein